MTAAAYATDLATTTADTAKGTIYRQDSTAALTTTGCLGTLTWGEPTSSTAGGTPTYDTDYFILGVATADKSFNATGVGGLGVATTNAATIPTDGAVFFWLMFLAPNSVSVKTSGGIQALIGSSSSAYYRYYVDGDDTHPYGGWKCHPVDPSITASATVGSPTTTRQYFGAAYNVDNAVSKGNPAALGALRFGRGYIECTNGDVTNGYATFDGAATFDFYNDSTNGWNRLGLFQYVNGSYQQQGLFKMGTSATAVDFRDSNRAIFVQPSQFVTANFNRFEVHNASSRVDWTGISVTALGTVSKGRFEMIANADVNIASCTFTDMDTFIFQSNATTNSSIFRRCGQVTLGGSTISNCTFDQSSATIALACGSSVSTLSDTDFISDGTGHAIEITGGTTHTLTGITFTGYASSSGSTGNEAVYVNIASGNVTIYADASFSYRTAGATVSVIAGAKTATVTVTNETGTAISGAAVAVYAGNATGDLPYKESVTISNSGTTATVTHTGHGMLTNDKVLIENASLWQNNGVFSITVSDANTYTYTLPSAPGSSPTGSITATYAAIFGTTDANGQISVTRVFSANQPVVGWARKSTSAPYYKTGPVTGGPISSTANTSMSALLLSDE